MLQTMHNFRCTAVSNQVAAEEYSSEHGPAPAAGWGRCHTDLITIAVVGVIVVSYLVGSLTSSVDTEQKLPHRY
jgi:hypothetical protein